MNQSVSYIYQLEQKVKQLKEELNQILNDPDFAHMKNCGICGELVTKAIDETSAINVKGSRLTWVCNDCDNLKQKQDQINYATLHAGCTVRLPDCIMCKVQEILKGKK